MSRSSRHNFRILSPSGSLEYISSKKAKAALATGAAKLLRPGVIERVSIPLPAKPYDNRGRSSAPTWGADLRADQIPELAAMRLDAGFGQTFLRYPQKSLDSYHGDFPALAKPGAGLSSLPRLWWAGVR